MTEQGNDDDGIHVPTQVQSHGIESYRIIKIRNYELGHIHVPVLNAT